MAWLYVTGLFLIGLYALHRLRHLGEPRRAAEQFAAIRGMERQELRSGWRLVGRQDGLPFLLEREYDQYSRELGGGLTFRAGEPRLVTRMRLALPGLPEGLLIRRATFRRRLTQGLGPPLVETGAPAFDRAFMVHGEDPAAVRLYLTPERRAAFTAAAEKLRALELKEGSLTLERRGDIASLEELESLAHQLGDLAARLGGGRGHLESVPWTTPPVEAGEASRTASKVIGVVAALVLILAVLSSAKLVLAPAEPRHGTVSAPPVRRDAMDVWEVHPDDTVRMVSVTFGTQLPGGPVRNVLPYLRSEDEILSLAPIGASIDSRTPVAREYRGQTYVVTELALRPSDLPYGYDVRVAHPPHLHVTGDSRLLSIGADPTRAARRVIAVAVPRGDGPLQATDFQPYKRGSLGLWEVLLFDVSSIQGHVSIHVAYRPGGDAPPLDWQAVASLR